MPRRLPFTPYAMESPDLRLNPFLYYTRARNSVDAKHATVASAASFRWLIFLIKIFELSSKSRTTFPFADVKCLFHFLRTFCKFGWSDCLWKACCFFYTLQCWTRWISAHLFGHVIIAQRFAHSFEWNGICWLWTTRIQYSNSNIRVNVQILYSPLSL